jgi:glycosyltransferase involved in cell wall biosynthesis
MAAVYRGADVYVNSSRYESDNTAAIESLACGTPVVGTDILGINKSLAFRWGDSIDLSRRLIHVFEHKDELKSETLDSAADWDIRLVMDDFHKVYRDVLKGA